MPRRCDVRLVQSQPDFGYTALPARVDLEERNPAQAGRTAQNEFCQEDAVDDLLLNEVICAPCAGRQTDACTVRAAFVFGHQKADEIEENHGSNNNRQLHRVPSWGAVSHSQRHRLVESLLHV